MTDETPSALIDAKIASLTDWRGPTVARLRALIGEPTRPTPLQWLASEPDMPRWEQAMTADGIASKSEMDDGRIWRV